jgi:inner membrane protein COX18
LHSVHYLVPWWAALPLTAAIVRAITLPLTINSRKITAKQISLFPLLHTHRHLLRKKLARELPFKEAIRQEALQTRRKRIDLFRQFRCETWKVWVPPLVQLPVFLSVIEGIRALTGANKGLLGLFLGSPVVPKAVEAAVAGEGATNAVAAVETAEKAIAAGIQADPSMATEGILWFQDLSAADPYLILPFALSASMFLALTPTSTLLRPFTKPDPTAKVTQPSKWQRRLRNSLKVIALAAGPLTLQMPSGILLYWISSSVLGVGTSVVLEKVLPAPKGVVPAVGRGIKGGAMRLDGMSLGQKGVRTPRKL